MIKLLTILQEIQIKQPFILRIGDWYKFNNDPYIYVYNGISEISKKYLFSIKDKKYTVRIISPELIKEYIQNGYIKHINKKSLQEIQIKSPKPKWMDLPPGLHIKISNIHGKGLFVDNFIPKNHYLGWAGSPYPPHISYYAGFINHSSPGNVRIVKQGNSLNMISIRDIHPDEELTTDYTKLPEPLDRNIEGFKELDEILIKTLDIDPQKVDNLYHELYIILPNKHNDIIKLIDKYYHKSNKEEKLVIEWLKNLPDHIRYRFYKDLLKIKKENNLAS